MKPLSRRAMLKGLLGASVISIALPPLEAMMNVNGTAYAGGTSFPRRFGIWFWGNGVLPVNWLPQGEGTDWTPSSTLSPLAPVRENLLVVSGLRVETLNTAPHEAGPAGLLSGDQKRDGTYSRPTIDQVIAEAVGGDTRFRSLETGVQRSDTGLSFSGPNLMNPPETDPHTLFNRLFGDGFRAPGDMSGPDPRLALRHSVLDAVAGQATRLQARLGAADRARIDQHLEGIRDIERQLEQQAQNPPNLAACRRADEPPTDIADINGRPDMSTRSRLMSDLKVMALACDQTRVFFHMYTQPVNNTLFANFPAGHHQLTHDEPGDQPSVQAILQLIMGDLQYFISAMRAIPEGAETLLDHSLVLCTTDCSYGRTHALDEYPIVIAGGNGLGLKQNYHLRARDENASKLSFSILQLMGVRVADFGVGPGLVTDGLAGLLA
jgi:hypothetical protein